jgi:SAM-dependent methyltransferase
MNCRHCAQPLDPAAHRFVDLGTAPPSNDFLRAEDLLRGETWLPLRALACPRCRLVQLAEGPRPEALFRADYVYYSSTSPSWLAHARDFVEQAVGRLALGPRSCVLEVASNDGYLLQHVRARGIRCVGVEPTAGTAAAARARGIETIGEFFGADFARRFVRERGRCDLVVGNNVLAHVPGINDFAAGLREVLAPDGCVTLEFPQLLALVRDAQFDTIYHEHTSYLSLLAVQRVLAAQGLQVWDVQTLPTHGGSLRVWAQHRAHPRPATPAVAAQLAAERAAGLDDDAFYRGQQARAEALKDGLLRFLLDCRRRGRRVVGYGAAAKGNTLLNFAGVRADLLPFVADASPHKQGLFLPGSRIPVCAPEAIARLRPDVVLILPWNLKAEIAAQLRGVAEWGGSFATAVPALQELPAARALQAWAGTGSSARCSVAA